MNIYSIYLLSHFFYLEINISRVRFFNLRFNLNFRKYSVQIEVPDLNKSARKALKIGRDSEYAPMNYYQHN